MDVTRTLAQFVVESSANEVPSDVTHEARRSFLNWTGCAIGGSRHEAVTTTLRVVKTLSGAPSATVIGHALKLDVTQAALMNAMSALVLDFDDAHRGERIILHPAGPIAAAAFAVAEQQNATGAEMLHAFVLGTDVACRIGNAVYASDSVGWFPTSTAGIFGAAAAAGRLLKLNEQQMVWALGIAAAQAAGLRATHGTMTKSFTPGRAANGGVLAALLAKENLTSATNAIEAPGVGFADLMGTSDHLDGVTAGLGRDFAISRNTYKPFACAIGMHPAVDACLQLRDRIKLKDIAKIEASVFPRTAKFAVKKHPRDGLEAKVSLTHSIAVALARGAAGEAEYSDAAAVEPALAAIRETVVATADERLASDQAHVRITMRGGLVVDQRIEHAVGSLERPLDDSMLVEKVRSLGAGVLPDEAMTRLIDLCWKIDEAPNMSAYAAIVATGAASNT